MILNDGIFRWDAMLARLEAVVLVDGGNSDTINDVIHKVISR